MASSCGGRRSSLAGAHASVLLLALLLRIQGCLSTRSWGQSVQSPEEAKIGGPRAYFINVGNPLHGYPYNVLVLPRDARGVDGSCTGTLVSRKRVLTAGNCCLNEGTRGSYRGISVRIGVGTLGAVTTEAANAFLPDDFMTVTKKLQPGENTVERKSVNLCILGLHQPSNLLPASIASPTTASVTNVTAATYGWNIQKNVTNPVLKGLPVTATSCASLGIQADEPEFEDLTATWDTDSQKQAAKLICVVQDPNVGYFEEGDIGGPLLVVSDLGAVEMWGALAGLYTGNNGKKIDVYVNIRAPYWEEFFADSGVPLGE